MDSPRNIFTRGARFVRDNPQLLYTLFLLIAIPLAFFWTSEQFLKIASENQDKLERNRIELMQDVFALFARQHMDDSLYLHDRIATIVAHNETMETFRVLGPRIGDTFQVIASRDRDDVGTTTLDDMTSDALIGFATGHPNDAIAAKFYKNGVRYWRSVRAITGTSSDAIVGYVLTDLSMAQADAVARAKIRDAYVVLALVIVLIFILLGRQARIIDYAALYKRLEEVDRMKDDFVSMAAHELRSPLTVIRGYVEMLSADEKFTKKGIERLGQIDVSAVRLNELIGDILDVAKLQEGRMSFTFQSVDVSQDIASTVDAFTIPARDKGLTLRYDRVPLPHISVDPGRFHQILVNLIGNAIKYTPQGEVHIRTEVRADHVAVRVSDTGMGISADDQKKLFEKFYRVRNEETQKITGTGLGLWITAQMVRAMKGTIAVESIKGKGTDFIVSFPVETK